MFGFGLVWLTASVWFQSAAAQNPAPEEVTKAQALFQAQDYDGATRAPTIWIWSKTALI
jgi:hypothetical protein